MESFRYPVIVTIHKTKISLTWTCCYCLFWLLFSFSHVKLQKKMWVTPATGHYAFFLVFLPFYFIFLCYPIFSRMTDIAEMQNFICTNHQHLYSPSHSMVHMHVLKHTTRKKQRNIQKVLTNIQKIFIYIFIYKHHSREWETNMHKIKFTEVLGENETLNKSKKKPDRAKIRWIVGFHLQEVHQRWRNTVAISYTYTAWAVRCGQNVTIKGQG